MSIRTQSEQNFVPDFAYFIYATRHPKSFCQFISNHFDLENSVKMTPTRRSFLYALFFICFSCSQVSTYLHSLGGH